jgi:hypothetical protein
LKLGNRFRFCCSQCLLMEVSLGYVNNKAAYSKICNFVLWRIWKTINKNCIL